MTDPDRLGRELGALRDAIEPIDADLTASVRARLTRAPAPRRRPIAAVAVLLAGLLVLAIPPARTAVASWLGIGNTQVDVVDDLPDPSPTAFPTSTLTPDEANAAPRPDEALSGPLVAALERDLGGVTEQLLIYSAFTLTSTPEESDIAFVKSITEADAVARVALGDGTDALWIDQPHTRTIGETTETVTDHTLIWARGGTEFRLVGLTSVDEAIALAESIR